MKFTKVLYREVEIGGIEYTVAMGWRGVYVREKGKRKWRAVHWRALVEVIADYEGQPEDMEPPVDAPLAAVEDGKGAGPEFDSVELVVEEPASLGSNDRMRKILGG